MKRCFTCARPFGLVRHYHFGKQFCSDSCKSRFLQRREQRMARWRNALTHPNLSASHTAEVVRGMG